MSHLDQLPTARPTGCPFYPPAELGVIRAQNPLVRMTYPDGHEGWLSTGYAETRAVMAVSSRVRVVKPTKPLVGKRRCQ